MSYDVVLQRFSDGEPTDAACEPALSILRAACQDPDGETFDTGYDLALRDGSFVDMRASGITSGDRFDSVSFTTRTSGFSPMVVTLMFDLARSSDMIIINSGGEVGSSTNPMIILTNEQQRGGVPSDWSPDWGLDPVLCESAQQLGELLDSSFERWHNWAYSKKNPSA